MADKFTMADFLQGRRLSGLPLDQVASEFDELTPPFGGAMPQSEAERRHHSLASLQPYASMLPPVAAYNGGWHLAQGVAERDLWTAAQGAAEAGLAMAPFARTMMRAPAAVTGTAPRSAPSNPSGPWTPGHMEQWLSSRYQPAAAQPRAWQPDRRWGNASPPRNRWGAVNKTHDEFMYPGLGRRPETPQELFGVLGRQVPRAVGAGAAVAGGNLAADTLVHGEPWQTATWRALVGPSASEPPAWWPQQTPNEKPLPPGGPQPPSRLREGW